MAELKLQLPPEVSVGEARLMLMVKLFEAGRLSLGQAAKFAGCSKSTFIELLGKMVTNPDLYRPYDRIPDTPRNRLLTFIAKLSHDYLQWETEPYGKPPANKEMLDDRSICLILGYNSSCNLWDGGKYELYIKYRFTTARNVA